MESSGRRSSETPPALDGQEARLAAAATALATLLPDQRWFGAKSRTIARVVPVDDSAVPLTEGALALFRVEFTEGAPDLYCIPLRAGTGPWADALDDPAFSLALVEHIRRGSRLPGHRGVFAFVAESTLGDILPEAAREAVRITSEQSNTSVVVGGRAILKLLRHLAPGRSPELQRDQADRCPNHGAQQPSIVNRVHQQNRFQPPASSITYHGQHEIPIKWLCSVARM
jgi:maltose alpha-D-glucosyltransferase/alpha-amylase